MSIPIVQGALTSIAPCAMVSVQPGPAHAYARRGVYLDAVEQRFERRVVDLDVTGAFGPRLGQAEGAPILQRRPDRDPLGGGIVTRPAA